MNYKDIISNINEDYNDKIINNRDKIINSYVEYYGEKYRDKINERFDSTFFIWFFHKKTFASGGAYNFSMFLNDFMKKDKSDVNPLYYLAKYKYVIRHNKIIGNTNDILSSYTINKELSKIPTSTLATTFYSENDEKLVVFPIYLTDDHTFFHELNHSLTLSRLLSGCRELNGYYYFYYFYKSGLIVTDSKGRVSSDFMLEELINDISSFDIMNIYHKKNGLLFDDIKLNGCTLYSLYLKLVMPFYDNYKEIYNEARITNNKNIMFKYIDKSKYILLNNYINNLVNSRRKVTEQDIEYVKELVSSMDIVPKEEMTIEEYQELYPNKKIKILKKSR